MISSIGPSGGQTLYLLTGMHRSGTSFLARRLQQSGLAFPGDLLPPADDNPEGYWEAREVVSLNNTLMQAAGQDWRSAEALSEAALENLDRLYGNTAHDVLEALKAMSDGQDFAIKDPRLCRLLPVWRRAAGRAGLNLTVAATTRPVEDVAFSLYRRRRDPRFAPAAIDTPASAVLLWLRYMLDLEYHSRDLPRRFVPFSDLPSIGSVADLAADEKPPETARLDMRSWLSIAGSLDVLLGKGDVDRSVASLDAARQALDTTLAAVPGAGGGDAPGAARAFAGRPTDGCRSGPVIGFLSGEPESRGHVYRVENRISALIGEPAGVFRIDPDRHSAEDVVSICDLIIVFRRQMDGWLERLAGKAQTRGIPVVFDIDDLVFDPDLMVPETFRFLQGKPPEVIGDWQARARRYRAALQAASHGWATTQALREEMLTVQPHVSVLRNGLSDHHARWAGRPARLREGDKLVIGYASGTPTHDHDFASIAAPLAGLLSARPAVCLEIVGPVSASALGPLADLGDRVRHVPLVDYFSLSATLARFDVNLAPLEPGNRFCECKSELKFFEAGIVSVPTIASATSPFREAIIPGRTGLIAGSTDDWRGALDQLADDAAFRQVLGTGASHAARDHFGPAAQKRDFLALCRQLLPGYPSSVSPA